MTLQTFSNSPRPEWKNAAQAQNALPVQDSILMSSGTGNCSTAKDFSLPDWLAEKEDRDDYLEACLRQDVAWQIRINREAAGMTQADLSARAGTTQSSIARAEDPSYGKHSLAMLTRIAHAFDCALLVRFVSYKEFLQRTSDTSVEALTVGNEHE